MAHLLRDQSDQLFLSFLPFVRVFARVSPKQKVRNHTSTHTHTHTHTEREREREREKDSDECLIYSHAMPDLGRMLH